MNSVTVYALQRVLMHLGEDQQSPKPEEFYCAENYLTAWRWYVENFVARAAARVIVKRELRAADGNAAGAWQAAKDAQ
jgi:hypothetical protein